MQSAVVIVAVEASSTLPAAEIDTLSHILPLRRLSIPERATVLEFQRCDSEGPAHWLEGLEAASTPMASPRAQRPICSSLDPTYPWSC